MKLLIIFLLLLSSSYAYDLCDYIELKTCDANTKSMERNNSASFPNSTSAALNNPLSLNMEKGFGIESLFFNSNTKLGLVTGSGRIGAAIAQTPTQESFFSNIGFENNLKHRERKIEKLLHAPGESYAFSFVFNVFGKKKKKGLQVDIGLIAKRNTELEENYFGAGVTISINKVLSFS